MRHLIKLLVCVAVLTLPLAAGAQTIKERADAAFEKGNYEEAQKSYNSAAAIASNETESSALSKLAEKAKNAGLLLNKANSLWDRGSYEDAVSKYNDLLTLNPKDPVATKRVAEGEYKQQLSKAMYWYNRKEYGQALACFRKSGSTTDWSQAQLNAYRRSLEEYTYSTWKAEKGRYTSAGEKAALDIVQNYPDSRYIDEVKKYLYEFYMYRDDYTKASQYASTTAQRTRLQMAREEYNKNKAKQERKAKIKSSTTIPFDPAWSLGAELVLLGSEPLEAAIPVEVRLLEADSRFNIAIGARIAARGMLSGDSATYKDGDTRKQTEGSFSYYQLSPYAKARLNFSSNISNGGGFFVSAIGRMNYNFSYTYTEEVSDVNSYGKAINTNTYKYHPDNILTPLTFTFAGELGYGSELFELYFYYSYDITRAVSASKVNNMQNDPTDPHFGLASISTYGERYAKTGFFGAGLRLYLTE